MKNYKLTKLQVTNFRNLYEELFEFSEGINCIFGENGNGKTNVLEAIYFLIKRKSFRKNTSFPQIINIECESGEITFNSLFENENSKESYSGKLSLNSSLWFRSGLPSKQKIEAYAEFINPFDSYQFHTIPAFRRNWIDQHISVLDTEYKKVLNKYNQTLKMRNNLLSKRPSKFKDQVKALDVQFAEYSEILVKKRSLFLEDIKSLYQKTFKWIFDETHELEIKMESKFMGLNSSQIESFFDLKRNQDIESFSTQYGIHRDDYVFHIDGVNSYEFSSLGQQKMSFLSLIFAYIELFRYKFISYPMVLIDDVSGELDNNRWKNLISYLEERDFQVFITTANENFKKQLESIKKARKFMVENGHVKSL